MNAQQIIEKYFNAWTNADLATAGSFLADDLDFRGSIDELSTAAEFLNSLSQFVTLLKEVKLVESYFGEDGGALLYDCITNTPAGTVRSAEFFKVTGDKITEIRLVFDATELRKLVGR